VGIGRPLAAGDSWGRAAPGPGPEPEAGLGGGVAQGRGAGHDCVVEQVQVAAIGGALCYHLRGSAAVPEAAVVDGVDDDRLDT
jgi:hypothetical protein